MKVSAGKLLGMRRLADNTGRWRMLALDQRGPMAGPIARKRGTQEAPFADMARCKELLSRHLAAHASALLLDPLYGYPACLQNIPPGVGLMMSLEHSVTEATPGGRQSRSIPGLCVGKIRRMGADAVKVLIWHRADASPEVRAHQQAYVRAAGQACADHDIVFLLEILTYPLEGEDPVDYAAARTRHVLDAVQAYVDPACLVDIYKLESPIAQAHVPDPDSTEGVSAQQVFNTLNAMLPRPWVLLSAGASPADFEHTLRYAYRAGASGYLAGRSIWGSAFDQFPDWEAMARTAVSDAQPYMAQLNLLTAKHAMPWHQHRCWHDGIVIEHAGPEFTSRYGGFPSHAASLATA